MCLRDHGLPRGHLLRRTRPQTCRLPSAGLNPTYRRSRSVAGLRPMHCIHPAQCDAPGRVAAPTRPAWRAASAPGSKQSLAVLSAYATFVTFDRRDPSLTLRVAPRLWEEIVVAERLQTRFPQPV